MTAAALESDIERLTAAGPAADREQVRELFTALRHALSRGEVRAADPDPASPSGWRVHTWVKRGLLLGFKFGTTVELHLTANQERWPFLDKDTLPLKQVHVQSGIRIVPGGSSVRDGAYLGRGVICMPPMYINIGAHVGDETLVDSHALVGSCAQIGARVHLSAAAQIGGVLEPVGARRSSSKTTCSSVETAASTKARSSNAARCWPPERSSQGRPPLRRRQRS